MSESYRLRRKVMMMGEGNPFYGKHHTQETREKISIQRRGRPLSEEHKRRIGIGVRRYLERQKEIS